MPATIANFLRLDSIRARARASDFKLGKEILARGEVEIVEQDADHIVAKAGVRNDITQRRRVELRSTAAGLSWRCTCTKKAERFCKHCVAAALAAR